MKSVVKYIIWFAVTAGLIWAGMRQDSDEKKAVGKEESDRDEKIKTVSFLVILMIAIYYRIADFYRTASFDSNLTGLVDAFTKKGQFPTLSNFGSWNFLAKYLAFVFVLCLVINLIQLFKYKKDWIWDIAAEAATVSVVFLLLNLLLLLRQWIAEHLMLVNIVVCLLEIVVYAVGAAVLFLPIYAIGAFVARHINIGPVGPVGPEGGSGGPEGTSENLSGTGHSELLPSANDLPDVLYSGTDVYRKVMSYGYGGVWRNSSDPSDEITITVVYSMTDSEASTDAGHFFFF